MLSPVETTPKPTALQKAAVHLPTVQQDLTRIAVLLNRNARRVTDRMARRIERIVGTDHVFYSRSIEEAEGFAREIVQRGYGTVVCGGGDGTLAQAINLVERYVNESNQWRAERFLRYGEKQELLSTPRFGFLRLGTGNGMTSVVGARDPIDDIKRIVDYAPGRTHVVPLIEQEGERFLLGGAGYDSVLLNDYNLVKARTKNRLLKPIMHSVLGYFAAIFSRTVPAYLFGKAPVLEGRVVNHGRAFYIDPRRGDAAVEIEPGATMFEGRASIITAGTIPYFGYGFRVFPFSSIMPGMMHLRVSTIGPIGALANLPSIWRGHYRNPRHVLDFLVDDVRVDLDRPFPFQHSGDAQGLRDNMNFRITDEPLRMVDLHPQRYG